MDSERGSIINHQPDSVRFVSFFSSRDWTHSSVAYCQRICCLFYLTLHNKLSIAFLSKHSEHEEIPFLWSKI
jgi:heterodisulfide reductase subunit A-like polyferredoxin